MKSIHYKAYDLEGKLQKGNLYLSSEEEATAFLIRNNLTPVEIKTVPQSFIYRFIFRFFSRISFQQKIFLIRNLYLVLRSGLNLDRGLNIIIKESSGGLRDFLLYLNYNLQRGEPLHKTFAYFPNYFSQVEIETIKAGEISGNLIQNLEKLADNLEKQRQIKNEIISNLIYPAIVLVLTLAVLVILITFVIPKIGILLSQLTSKPPLLTRLLISVSNFVNANLGIITLFSIFVLFFVIFIFFLPKTRLILNKMLMKMPIVSRIYFSLALSQSLFVLRSLLSAGLSLIQSLELSAQSTFFPSLRLAFLRVGEELKRGKKLGEALSSQEDFPPFLASILGIASETGSLEDTLLVMEEYYLEDFRNSIRNFLNLLQPVMLIFVGIIVGFVAIVVLVPIYQQISEQLQMEGRGGLPGEVR
ncbi:MAG: type II secretion system F family protein [Patescibacteria group bacterium]|nr:type II secretion system F family protein [Patescibacteria group bacterium]